MKIDAEQRAMLVRMEAAHAETERHLAVIERQIEACAERMTTSNRVKARQSGRASATWSRADERDFQANVTALRFRRCGEIDALGRKLARQAGAIAAFRVRYGINERAGRACHDTALSPHRTADPRRTAGQTDREWPHQRGT